MPPRPHPVVLASLVFGCLVVMALVMPRGVAGAAGWRWPLRGPVVGAFHLSPHAPFARGQRRGIDVSAAPGAEVRVACPGRVTFAGSLPRRGLAVSVRCGALVATYLGLGRLAVRAGLRVGRGQGLGALGPSGRLRLGARRAGDRRGYLDPRTLLADERPALPRLGPTPRALRLRSPHPLRPAAQPPAFAPAPAARAAAARPLPWPAYPALALVASALPVGGLVRRRRRRRAGTVAALVHASRPPG
jgi:murein DD-endopeptidase MepM/ murein hydrolase activator NlpD